MTTSGATSDGTFGGSESASRPALGVDEQIALLAGADLWHTVDVPAWGLPAVRMTDGPNGARGHEFDGEASTCFPVGTALAASWDLDLMRRVGEALAVETLAKGARLLLAPTVNLHRHPLAGRNFECYSEDPLLTAEMAAAYITGLQSRGVGACIKHFAGNESEFERHTISSVIDERTLRECYLLPFEHAVKSASPWAIMTAYNRINGVAASDHHHLVTEVLRGEWGFDGTVISDWGGTRSTVEALTAGMDLEMPGPPRRRGAKLRAAFEAGEVTAQDVADAASRVIRLLQRAHEAAIAGVDAGVDAAVEAGADFDPDQVAFEAARAGMVLLTNDGLLPLGGQSHSRSETQSAPTRIAVIGPNADPGQIQGGGSSRVTPRHVVTPLQGIRDAFPDAKVVHAPGCRIDRWCRPLDYRTLLTYSVDVATNDVATNDAGGTTDSDPVPGALLEVFASADLSGPPVQRRVVRTMAQRFYGAIEGVATGSAFSARVTGRYWPEVSGEHRVGLAAAGSARVLIDGVEVLTADSARTADGPGATFYGWGTDEMTAPVWLDAGKEVTITVEFRCPGTEVLAGTMVGLTPPEPVDMFDQAVAAAAAADVAVMVVGLDGIWETEGTDRASLALPGVQADLIRAVARANPRTVVVVNAGSPVEMPWRSEVAAIVQSWYPGQEFGQALGEILSGVVSPSGRLPSTFPVRIEDTPAVGFYPGADGEVHYGEGINIGYRHYVRSGVAPMFPFGHGLTYTTFSYGVPSVDGVDAKSGANLADSPNVDTASDAAGWRVGVPVMNTGTRDGVEVVQVYASWPNSQVERPARQLVGWARVEVPAGGETTAEVLIAPRRLMYWDVSRNTWVLESGSVELHIGSSSMDERVSCTLEVP